MCKRVYTVDDAALLLKQAFEIEDSTKRIAINMRRVLDGVEDTEDLHMCVHHMTEKELNTVGQLFLYSMFEAYPDTHIRDQYYDSSRDKQRLSFGYVAGYFSFMVNNYIFGVG